MTADLSAEPPTGESAGQPAGVVTPIAGEASPTDRLVAIEVEYRARLLAWAASLAADVAADAEGAAHLLPPGDPHFPRPPGTAVV